MQMDPIASVCPSPIPTHSPYDVDQTRQVLSFDEVTNH
jgi:hypothetical protein